MSQIGAWLRGTPKPASEPTRPMTAADESKELNEAMTAASLIMNDDIDGANRDLADGNSAFHQLGRGIILFMRSILGFEQENMREAALRLSEAETAAWNEMRRSQKDAGEAFHSKIYPPGSEFALCYAMTQLMSAVVGVLNESLTESIRGFYKLRKAFMTLHSIMEIEHKYMMEKANMAASSKSSLSPKGEHMPSGFGDDDNSEENSGPSTSSTSADKAGIPIKIPNGIANGRPRIADEDSDLEFVDADEAHSGVQTPANYLGHVDSPKLVEAELQKLSINGDSGAVAPTKSANQVGVQQDVESELFTNDIDVFVHSGTNLCYGLLLLIISMVPPAFSRLLYVIGFKGDRERGISLLWKSTRYDNIIGAFAGLVLLGYYNGLMGFCDILINDRNSSSGDFKGYPKTRLAALLKDMAGRFPQSRIWRLEQARMYSSNRDLKTSLEILNTNDGANIKQIAALNMFEKSLCFMFTHQYELTASSFLSCIELNSWSHALYYFCMGSTYVDLYRDCRESDPDAARRYKDKATEILKKAPTCAGRRRLMAKQLPFDNYVVRKVQKWEERATSWGVDFIDAIGVTPLEEMIYLWNGGKRMSVDDLETSLKKLEWSRTSQPAKHESNPDELGMWSLLRSSLLRNLGRYDDARECITENVTSRNRNDFKGHLFDDWSCPSAYYEMAVISWFEKDLDGADTKAKVADCDEWLRKVERWETYVLDTRLGVKVKTALETLKIYHSMS